MKLMKPFRSLLVAAAILPLYFSPCDGPTEPQTIYEGPLQTAIGRFEYRGPQGLVPAVADGLEEPGATSCLGNAARDLGWPREKLAGVLDGWRIDVVGRGSGILFAPRKMLVCAESPDCARNGAWHECLTAIAYTLRTCPHLSKIGLCGEPWGPGFTVSCEPC